MTPELENKSEEPAESAEEGARGEGAEESERPSRLLSPRLRVLVFAMTTSLLLHMSPLLTMLSLDIGIESDLDTEWFGEFEDLQQVGVGQNGQWAKLRAPAPEPEEEKEEEKPPEPVEEEEKPEEKPPEPEVPKEEPKKEPEKPKKPEPKPKPKKELATKEPEKKPDEPKPEAKPEPEVEEPKPEAEIAEVASEGLPGLERTGPSNLPTLKNYAPGNARFTALIRFEQLRGTPYAAPTSNLIRKVPDFRILLDSAGPDPVETFDSIFGASSDPQYIQETFLAVRHSMGEDRLRDALGSRYATEVPWKKYRGYPIRDMVPPDIDYQDPRKILIAGPDLALVTRTEWLKTLTDDQGADSPIRNKVTAEDGKAPEKFTLVQGLERIEEAANEDTLALVSVSGLAFFIPGYGRLPRFESARLEIKGLENPTVNIDLQFASKDRAIAFAKACPAMKDNLGNLIPGGRYIYGKYINRLDCEAQDEYVTVNGTYTKQEFTTLLGVAFAVMPNPPGLESLPKPPPKIPSLALPGADMGGADMNGADMGAAPRSPDMGAEVAPAKDALIDPPAAAEVEEDAPAKKPPASGSTTGLLAPSAAPTSGQTTPAPSSNETTPAKKGASSKEDGDKPAEKKPEPKPGEDEKPLDADLTPEKAPVANP
ncbi:MAG: hypothetical protein VYE40_16200 [Myxococcota bacterium]|nr:hypothetical protein [Myxococcota bacterium]